MEIYYDDEIIVSGVGVPAGEAGGKVRLVILKANDPYIGMLGILQYLDPPLPERGEYPKRLGIGDTVFVMSVDDAERVHRELLDVPGVAYTKRTSCLRIPQARRRGIQVTVHELFRPERIFYRSQPVAQPVSRPDFFRSSGAGPVYSACERHTVGA